MQDDNEARLNCDRRPVDSMETMVADPDLPLEQSDLSDIYTDDSAALAALAVCVGTFAAWKRQLAEMAEKSRP